MLSPAGLIGLFAHSPDHVLIVGDAPSPPARNPAAAQYAPNATTAAEQVATDARPALHAACEQVRATGIAQTFEWGEISAGGIKRWFSTVVSAFEAGGARALLISSRDITALKQSEQRLRRSEQLLVDTHGVAHLGTWEWDVTQPNATWSAELYRIYGLTPETYTPSYDQYLTKVHPDDRQRVIDATNRVFHEHVPYSHDERILHADGTFRYLHTWAYPVLDHDGKLVRLVGVCQDITDRKRIEEELHQLNIELEQRVSDRTRQLESALRDLETFNSMVSHDLRGPLGVIQMAADIIADEPHLPEKVPGLLARIRRAVDNMSSLVEDLLMLARAGEDALQPQAIDVSALVADVIAELRLGAPDRVVDVRVESGMRAIADPTLFRGVLTNLVGNAWKYTGRTDGARIEIGKVAREDGIALFVRDNGIGFDMAHRDRLFSPFTRLPNAKDFKGTGVGLATVQRIVERHGGRVHAEGAPGKGATFFVVLPRAAWTQIGSEPVLTPSNSTVDR